MKTLRLNSYAPQRVGLMQAGGVVAYILAFASLVSAIEKTGGADPPQILAMAFFLTAFVTSALICGSLVLGYSALLLLDKQTKRAVEVLVWTAGYLALAILLAMLVLVLLSG
jgi:hypothetical protein